MLKAKATLFLAASCNHSPTPVAGGQGLPEFTTPYQMKNGSQDFYMVIGLAFQMCLKRSMCRLAPCCYHLCHEMMQQVSSMTGHCNMA